MEILLSYNVKKVKMEVLYTSFNNVEDSVDDIIQELLDSIKKAKVDHLKTEINIIDLVLG